MSESRRRVTGGPVVSVSAAGSGSDPVSGDEDEDGPFSSLKVMNVN